MSPNCAKKPGIETLPPMKVAVEDVDLKKPPRSVGHEDVLVVNTFKNYWLAKKLQVIMHINIFMYCLCMYTKFDSSPQQPIQNGSTYFTTTQATWYVLTSHNHKTAGPSTLKKPYWRSIRTSSLAVRINTWQLWRMIATQMPLPNGQREDVRFQHGSKATK